jgi:hypothetical protein
MHETIDNKLCVKVKLLLVDTGPWRWMPEYLNEAVRNYTADETPFGLVSCSCEELLNDIINRYMLGCRLVRTSLVC